MSMSDIEQLKKAIEIIARTRKIVATDVKLDEAFRLSGSPPYLLATYRIRDAIATCSDLIREEAISLIEKEIVKEASRIREQAQRDLESVKEILKD